MLSNHLQDGIETAKLMWSRIPNSEDGQFEGVGLLNSSDANAVESLDYEVIENYAYREEQVCVCVGFFFFFKKKRKLFTDLSSSFVDLQAQRGKLYVGYYVAVKWFFALLIGIGKCCLDFGLGFMLID